ncbi:unnamed protein product [Calypogeia fissa]
MREKFRTVMQNISEDAGNRNTSNDALIFFEDRCQSLGEPDIEVLVTVTWPDSASHGSWFLESNHEHDDNDVCKGNDPLNHEPDDNNDAGGANERQKEVGSNQTDGARTTGTEPEGQTDEGPLKNDNEVCMGNDPLNRDPDDDDNDAGGATKGQREVGSHGTNGGKTTGTEAEGQSNQGSGDQGGTQNEKTDVTKDDAQAEDTQIGAICEMEVIQSANHGSQLNTEVCNAETFGDTQNGNTDAMQDDMEAKDTERGATFGNDVVGSAIHGSQLNTEVSNAETFGEKDQSVVDQMVTSILEYPPPFSGVPIKTKRSTGTSQNKKTSTTNRAVIPQNSDVPS